MVFGQTTKRDGKAEEDGVVEEEGAVEEEGDGCVERGAKSRTLGRSRIRTILRRSCTDRAKVIPAWLHGRALQCAGKWSRQFIRTDRVPRILTQSVVILPVPW